MSHGNQKGFIAAILLALPLWELQRNLVFSFFFSLLGMSLPVISGSDVL